MIDLRKAAEMALEALRNAEVVHMQQLNAMYALQEALAQPEHTAWVTAGEHTVPLKTYPPKREWVGLTDEEIDEKTDFRATVRYFENKLKEKNYD